MTSLKPGDIILVKGKLGFTHLIDDGIKFGESILEHTSIKGTYSHVCIYTGDNWIVEAQGGRLSGKGRLEKYAGEYDVGRMELSSDQFNRLMQAAESEFDLPYDWVGIFWIAVGILTGYWRKYVERKVRYCATFVNDAFEAVGFKLSTKKLPTPDDIANSRMVHVEKLG